MASTIPGTEKVCYKKQANESKHDISADLLHIPAMFILSYLHYRFSQGLNKEGLGSLCNLYDETTFQPKFKALVGPL